MEYPEISIVIGSWGSYNSCNQRALGSERLNLADFESWEEIEEELKKQGFRLKGIDEELFIQDIDGIPSSGTNWDYVHPKDLFETLKESGVLDDNQKYDTKTFSCPKCKSLVKNIFCFSIIRLRKFRRKTIVVLFYLSYSNRHTPTTCPHNVFQKRIAAKK